MFDEEAEQKFVQSLVKFFSTSDSGSKTKPSRLQQAAIFDKYVVPNKSFADCAIMVEAANGLADAMEKEISALKAGVEPDRDQQLAKARANKKSLRGFVTHAYKAQ